MQDIKKHFLTRKDICYGERQKNGREIAFSKKTYCNYRNYYIFTMHA